MTRDHYILWVFREGIMSKYKSLQKISWRWRFRKNGITWFHLILCSVWKGNGSVQLQNLVHQQEAYRYWERKEKIEPDILLHVNWEAVGKAIKTSVRSIQHFVTNHTIGMCGVEKWMKLWKQESADACSCCGIYEDANHVCQCKGKDADAVSCASL